jgi:hypothetical protein
MAAAVASAAFRRIGDPPVEFSRVELPRVEFPGEMAISKH